MPVGASPARGPSLGQLGAAAWRGAAQNAAAPSWRRGRTPARAPSAAAVSGAASASSQAKPSVPTGGAYASRPPSAWGNRLPSMRWPSRSDQARGALPCSQSGATGAKALRGARRGAPSRSNRWSPRMAAQTWGASVRCCPRACSRPSSRQRLRRVSGSRAPPSPSPRRSRHALSPEKWKPGSVSSSPRSYCQSIRPRTASAAWRAARCSRNGMTVTRARGHGAKPGGPARA
jgi:hypothetical protein